MGNFVRKIVPQKLVNNFKHLPLAMVANSKYGFPSTHPSFGGKKIKIIGVTGTDGKTTTVNMIYQILKASEKKVSMVSTINAVIGGKEFDTGFHVTSPDPFMVQKFIKQAVKNGDEYLILEVTSHGLDQFRFWGIRFDIGVVTNITHEHLDYHKSWENYFKAKTKLVKNSKLVILNRDEKHFERLSKFAIGKVISFGLHKNASFNPIKFPLKIKLPGEYNLENAMAAAATGINLGVDSKTVKSALSNFENLTGRMEEVENDLGIKIFVDFAHTPNALENALKALRKESSRFTNAHSNDKPKLISVFGCAGFRDVEKRALMGEISVKFADITIITVEDPRGMIDQINKQILEGVGKAGGKVGENVFIENDRKKAIDLAIKTIAKKGDMVGVFGKGHEQSMNIDGKKEIPWSDQEAIRKVLGGSKD